VACGADKAKFNENAGFNCTLAEYSQYLFSGMWGRQSKI
jgi:hypothetical protein